MKKLFLIIQLILGITFSRNLWAYTMQVAREDVSTSPEECQKLLQKIKTTRDVPLRSLFSDANVAEQTVTCFTQKIKSQATEKQFETYENMFSGLFFLFQNILFYKGKTSEQLIAVYELLYRFQEFFFAKMEDKNYSVQNENKLTGDYWEKERALEQEILKISNIEARRQERKMLSSAALGAGNFFYYSYSAEPQDIRKFEEEFIDFIYNLVLLVKNDKYFMDFNNSVGLFYDCQEWEIMTGQKTTGWGTDKITCPIPFP